MGTGHDVQVSAADCPGAKAADEIRDVLGAATQALFACYALEAGPPAHASSPELGFAHYLSVLGFSSAQGVTGSVALAASPKVLVSTCPVPGGDSGDWTGELVNQLLGRLKNSLLNRGLEVRMAVPVVIAGSNLELPAEHSLRRVCVYSTVQGHICVCIDLAIPRDFALSPETSSGDDYLAEGEALMF